MNPLAGQCVFADLFFRFNSKTTYSAATFLIMFQNTLKVIKTPFEKCSRPFDTLIAGHLTCLIRSSIISVDCGSVFNCPRYKSGTCINLRCLKIC